MSENQSIAIAQPLAPEDLRPGEYVSVMQVLVEECPFLAEDSFWSRGEPRRMYFLPGTLRPLKVVDVCLPFVLVEQPCGEHRALDVRQCRLARLTEAFGQRAFKRLRPRKKKPAKP